MIWFTSDQHFAHANIIRYCERPFANIDEMDAALIADWNSEVAPSDTVYHLGDLTLGNWGEAHKAISQLNGYIKILAYPWHHDSRWVSDSRCESWKNVIILPPLVVLRFPEYSTDKHAKLITLCHYPLEQWEAGHYGAWHLHGHSHGAREAERTSAILDVGVDNAYRILGTWRPFSLHEVATILMARVMVK